MPTQNPRRRWRFAPVDWALPAAWGALALACGLRASVQIPDDMFITFRYAWNLAHGQGFVWNPGERVFGLTNPGHGLVLALLHGVTRIPVHVWAAIVFTFSLWALVVLLWREGRARGAGWEAAVGGTLVLGASYLWIGIGSASSSVLALLAAAALLVHRRPVLAGVLAGLAVWYRPDALVGVAALGVMAWLERRRPPWRWGFAAAGFIALGLVAAWLWFGSPLPGTLEAKRVMAAARAEAWTGPIRFWGRGAELMPRHFGTGWILLAALGVAGQWHLFARGGLAVRTLVLYGAGVAVAYPLLRVPFFHWYTVPPMTVLLLGAGAFAAGVGRAVAGALAPPGESPGAAPGPALRKAAGVAAALAVLALPLASYAPKSWERFSSMQGGTRYHTFRDAGLWIREHSLPEERIAYGEIGQLGYWSRRPLDDHMGLVTPEMLPYIEANDGLGAFLLRPPDFFVDHAANPIRGIVNRPWFDDAYYLVARIENPLGRDEPAMIYRKRPGAELPPSRPPWKPRRGRNRPDRGTGPPGGGA